VKILIDENLSPALVRQLAEVGAAAVHVAHCGLSGASDPVVWRYAFKQDHGREQEGRAGPRGHQSGRWPRPS
jgi:hypothetical protein